MRRAEAVVVGGGLAGMAAAFALSSAGVQTIHVAPAAPPDRRTSALMMPAVDYLTGAGLIDDPASIGHKLAGIRIIDSTERLLRAPETLFRASEIGLEAFGWNFPNVALMESFTALKASPATLTTVETTLTALDRTADGTRLTLGNGEVILADLVVGADGKKSLVRETANFRARENGFTQAALVCDLLLGRPLGDTSVEFHHAQGPFTLVPAGGNRANLVWIDDRRVLKDAQRAGKEHLAALFYQKSQHLFGTVELATPTHMFMLSTLTVATAGLDGVVLVGEAAHAFPPIGAQGLNLTLRDVADLAATLAEVDRTEPRWAEAVSRDYARRRSGDLGRTGAMVDALFRSLLIDMVPVQAARAAGLWALKLSPQLRRQAFQFGMGQR